MRVYKTEKNKIYVGEVKDVRKDAGNCPYCGLPVYVSSRQLLIYKNGDPTHKKCRKQND